MSVVVADNNNAAEEDRFLCMVTDETDTNWQTSRIVVNLPSSTTVSALYESVAKSAQYEPETFLLAWLRQQHQGEEEILLGLNSSATLLELGLVEKRNRFVLKQRDGRDPVRIEGAEITAAWNRVNDAASYSSSTSVSDSALASRNAGFVGLVNQAMTCYLNSMLQTLFMTPEFRNALYKWRFDGGPDDEQRSIPYQLQKLFVNLQTSKSHAVETTDVTKSFGWDSEEAWQQHDVQELCRVMFDALEKTFQDTDQEDLIKQLYEGQMQDYVKCLECGRVSARFDTYLDIPLVIKPFGSDVAFRSVEEALRAFVAPETLDGNNQYFCEQCNKKCNAHKGLRFTSFPYLLTLQLKRFDFDYVTFNRIKLNDRVEFPFELNLNGIIDEQEGHLLPTSEAEQLHNVSATSAIEEVVTTGSAATPPGLDGTGDDGEERRGAKVAEASDGSPGPYVYQLFSIMVHSGSAVGGHYYAYIRSFDDGKWYSFNDMSVLPITDEQIKRTYGSTESGSQAYYSSMYSSSANAYMLTYRQVSGESYFLKCHSRHFVHPVTFSLSLNCITACIWRIQLIEFAQAPFVQRKSWLCSTSLCEYVQLLGFFCVCLCDTSYLVRCYVKQRECSDARPKCTQNTKINLFQIDWCRILRGYFVFRACQVSQRNVLPLRSNDLPDHLKRVVEAIREQEEASQRQAEIDRMMCKIKLFYDDPKDGKVQKQLTVQKDVLLRDAVIIAQRWVRVRTCISSHLQCWYMTVLLLPLLHALALLPG